MVWLLFDAVIGRGYSLGSDTEGRSSSMASDKQDSFSDTPTVFSREEAKQIREMVKASTDPPTCPRCDEVLEIGPAALHEVRSGRYTVRALRCPVCHRLLSIKDAPEK